MMIDIYAERSKQLNEVNPVVTAFAHYLTTNDKSQIKKFSNEILEKTLNLYANSRGDRESGWYKAIERELSRRERGKERWVYFVLGVIVTVIGGLILWFIISKLGGEP